MSVVNNFVLFFLTALAVKQVQGLMCNQCGKFIPTSVTPCLNLTASNLRECPYESTHCAMYKSPDMVVYDCAKDCEERAIWSFDIKCCNTDGCNSPPPPAPRIPTTADRTHLTDNLLRNYRKIIPDNATVTFAISLIDFQVLENKHALSLQTWISEEWIDHRLSWNPVPYGGLTQITLESDWVWKPDITLLNSKDTANMMKCWNSNAIIKSNGTVTWMQSCSMMSPCNFTMVSDDIIISNCTLKFGSWTYNENEMDINTKSDDIDLSHLENSSGYEIVGYKMRKNTNLPDGSCEPCNELEYKLVLKSTQT